MKELNINLDSYTEQDLPYQCPECTCEMTWKNISGWGNYPVGGYRSTMKPNKILGIGFECPACFSKSCFHTTEIEIESIIGTIIFNIKKKIDKPEDYPAIKFNL